MKWKLKDAKYSAHSNLAGRWESLRLDLQPFNTWIIGATIPSKKEKNHYKAIHHPKCGEHNFRNPKDSIMKNSFLLIFLFYCGLKSFV